jgi:hypothetical protein
MDEGTSHLAHFVTAVLRPALNEWATQFQIGQKFSLRVQTYGPNALGVTPSAGTPVHPLSGHFHRSAPNFRHSP